MNRKDWNKLLDKYLVRGTMSVSEYEALNPIQVAIIQELKKSLARIKSKLKNEKTNS